MMVFHRIIHMRAVKYKIITPWTSWRHISFTYRYFNINPSKIFLKVLHVDHLPKNVVLLKCIKTDIYKSV